MNPIFKRKIAVDAAMSVSMLLLMGLFVILFKSGTNATFSAQNTASQYRFQVDSIDQIRDLSAASNKKQGYRETRYPCKFKMQYLRYKQEIRTP